MRLTYKNVDLLNFFAGKFLRFLVFIFFVTIYFDLKYSPLGEATAHRKALFRGGWNKIIE